MNDNIILSGVSLTCRIGTTPEERAAAQPIVVDAVLELNLAAAGASDSIADTVDYVEVCTALGEVARKEFVLVEALAEQMAGRLLDRFPFEAVTLTVSKPEALRQFGVANTAIRITRRHA